MNPQKEWLIFLRRIQAEFAIQKYSIYAGDGMNMKHRHGTELQALMLEQYLSYETTVILTDQQESVLVTRFQADGVLYLVALYTNENGLTENETRNSHNSQFVHGNFTVFFGGTIEKASDTEYPVA